MIADFFEDFFERKAGFYVILLIAMIVQTFPFGFRYFAYADDWFSLGMFSLYTENIWQDVVLHFELYGFRPLAGIAEAFLVSAFWPNMWPVLLTITLMRFFTLCLLEKVLARSHIVWGRAATVFFAFFPTLTESTYWLSASVRIVPAGFFAVLAAYTMLRFIYRDGRKWLAIALISGLVAQGFYEQGIIFTFVLTFGVLVLHWNAIKHRILLAWPFVNLAIIGIHYFIFRNVGWLGGRVGEEVDLNFIQHIPIVVARIGRIFVMEQYPTVTNTLRWGIVELLPEHLPLILSVAILSAILALFVIFERRDAFTSGRPRRSILAALVLGTSTLAVFFVLVGGWVYVRNFYFVLIGIAILVEMLVRLTEPRRNRLGVSHANRAVVALRGLAAGVVVFIFSMGYILEVDSLRKAEYHDNNIIVQIVAKLEYMGVNPEEEVWLFGVRWNYERKINPRIVSQLRDEWSVNAHYRYAHASRNNLNALDQHHWIVPVKANEQETNMEFIGHVLLGLDNDLQVRELYFSNGYLFFADDNEIFGVIITDEGGKLVMEAGQ